MNQITSNMKPILFILLLFIAISCHNKADFYIGTWELNKDNGVSTLTLSENKKIKLDFRGNRILEYLDFKTIKISPNEYDIVAGQDKNCIKFTLQKLSVNQCIGCNYKCYINENMIDEVFIARKDQYPLKPVPISEKEIIILPKVFKGDFFIVYQDLDDNQSRKIEISNKGIGINQGEPDFKQLFNANRIFRFEGQEKIIPIANPNDYHGYLNTEIDSLFKNEEVIVIQQGFNQSGRTAWNKEHAGKVKNSLNIEYFEVRWMKD